ncbi:MAG: inositol monophosphatase [Ectothiorhodospiraceae bacterium]|nr:inositol monophosphatase [Ectothiorhodospiraceae bacterium]
MTMNIQTIESIKCIANEELKHRFSNVVREHKTDGSFLTEADLVMQRRVQTLLLEQYPDITFLGEEMSTGEQQHALNSPQGVWILDPLDGTSNFAAGIPYYSVSLALIKSGKVTWGMVYDPERDECFSATQGQGALLNNKPMFKPESGVSIAKSTAVIDFKRLNSTLAARIAAEPPYSSQRSFGGVALDWCWLAAGRFHLYLHGKQNIWDYAAGHLVFSELCDYSCTLEGEDVFDFSLNPRSAVAAVNEHLFDQWCDYLGVTRQSH